MFLIRKETIEHLKNNYGESSMLSGYAIVQGMSSNTNEAMLLLSENKLIILFISNFSSNLVQKVEFDKK